jgi:TonB family protein
MEKSFSISKIMKLFVFLLILVHECIYGQIGETRIVYYNRYDVVTVKDSAYYYEVIEDNSDTIKSFFSETAGMRAIELRGEDGFKVMYHENGRIRYKAETSYRRIKGEVVEFYPDGAVRSVTIHEAAPEESKDKDYGKRLDYGVIQYNDSSGTELVKAGNGFMVGYEFMQRYVFLEKGRIKEGLRDSTWVGYNDKGELCYVETWDNGLLASGKSYTEGNEMAYDRLKVMAEPLKGMENFYREISSNLIYPKKARKNGTEGRVFMEFVVEKDGAISNIKVIRGIGSGCDEAAATAVQLSGEWKPGLQRGRIVRSRFNLAIIFKLN